LDSSDFPFVIGFSAGLIGNDNYEMENDKWKLGLWGEEEAAFCRFCLVNPDLGDPAPSLFSAYMSAPAPNLIYNAKLGPVDEKGAP